MNEQLKEIALRVAREIADEQGLTQFDEDEVIEFATRIIAALPKPEPVGKIVRNRAGQICTFDMGGDAFDISKYIGAELYTTPPDQSQRIAELERQGSMLSTIVDKLERQNEELRKDAERLDRVERMFFTHSWNSVIGSGSVTHWQIRGDYRHQAAKMVGDNFRDAIDAAKEKS